MAFSHVDADGQQGMWLMRSDGTARVRITPPGFTTLVPAMSKDRRTLAYVRPSTTGQQVHLMAANGTGDRALFSTPPAQCPNQSRPAFSPNGRDLAIMCVLGTGSTSILLTDLLGNISTTLAAGFVGNPTFSPDGTKVAYWATTDGNEANAHLETVTVDAARTRTVLTTGDTHDNDPCWSPDGTAIVFSRVTGGVQHVWTLSVADRSLAQVTSGAAPEHNPSWSPDSTQIAYLVGGDTSKIWITGRDGSDAHPISTAVKMDGPPEWTSR
jgi:Tol biopolymer transport system component